MSKIEKEKSRTYVYTSGYRYVVKDLRDLQVSASGGHRLITETGQHIYVASGWVAIEFDIPCWEA